MQDSVTAASAWGGAALAAFVGYLLLVVAVGVWASRFSSGGVSEYFLAGRSLGRWVVALSAVVSGRSAWLFVGFTGQAWLLGVSAIWAAVGYVTVEFLLFWGYARRLRRFAEAHDCITLPDFFAARFDDRRGVLRLLLVLVFLVFLPTYVGSQFMAGGKVFASSFGLDADLGLLLTAGIVLVYTVLGGFLAVSLTDVVQAVLMLVALVLLPVVALVDLGGWDGLLTALAAQDPALADRLLDPFALSPVAFVSALAIGLGSPGNPHILVRFMAIRDPEQLKVSAIVATVWNVLLAVGATLAGLVGRAWFPTREALPGGDMEALFPTLAQEHLPPVLFGVVVAAIFAAIMSTTDSQLLVAASAVVRDGWEKVVRRGHSLDGRRLVVASRLVVVLLVLLSVGLGFAGGQLVYWFVLLAWAGLGAALGPTSILALYWRGTTLPGVVAGLLAGGGTVFVWVKWWKADTGLYELLPGFAAGLLATVLVSLLTRGRARSAAERVPAPRERQTA